MCQVPSLSEEGSTMTSKANPIALTRRAALRWLSGGLLITTLLLLRSSAEILAQDAPSDAEPVFTGETFVAETRDELFIAVIIGPSEAGTANRPARAFVCDNQRLGQWFVGELVGDELTLLPETREDEATPQPDTRLIGTLSAGRVTGEARHVGQTVMFVAAPAAGLGGYWEGVRPPGGVVLAASSTGAHFLGQAPLAAMEIEEGPHYEIEGIVTLPDGTQLPLNLNATEPEVAIFRTVVLNDGRHCLIR
jgi:hypothetical protein